MIELRKVDLGFGAGPVLRDVSLHLAQGNFFFLTGPSGAGKTTLLRVCAGELQPQNGEVRLFGTPIQEMDRDAMIDARRRLGVVDQAAQFLDHLSVLDNVVLPLTVRGPVSAEMRQQCRDLLAWVGLGDRQDALPPTLSGGERQRAALARAVVTSPDAILADEPTGNLDWEMSLRLLSLLGELNKLGKAVLIATHDLALIRAARGIAQARVLRLKDGDLSQAGADL